MSIDQTKILTPDEYVTCLKHIKAKACYDCPLRWRLNLAIFRFVTGVGLRVGELVGANLGDLHLKSNWPWMLVRKEVAKGGRERRAWLWWDADCLKDIQSWIRFRRDVPTSDDNSPLICSVFPATRGVRLDRFNVRKRFLECCASLGEERLRTLTIHHGRHTFATMSLRAGRSLADVRDQLGHSNIATTSCYLHVLQDPNPQYARLYPSIEWSGPESSGPPPRNQRSPNEWIDEPCERPNYRPHSQNPGRDGIATAPDLDGRHVARDLNQLGPQPGNVGLNSRVDRTRLDPLARWLLENAASCQDG
jgi:hypothetical protein